MVSKPGADPSMLDLFRTELEKHSLALEKGLSSVEGVKEHAPALARAARSLRGAARIVGLGNAARLAQAMEEVLTAAGAGTRQLGAANIDPLRTATALFRQLAACPSAEIPLSLAARVDETERLIGQLAAPPDSHPPQKPEVNAAVPPAVDTFLLDLFRTELETHSRVLEEGLVEAEARQVPEKLHALMRAAHSLKGASRILALDSAVRLAHAMEDMLSAAQKGGRQLAGPDFDLLLRATDVFSSLAKREPADIPGALADESPRIEELAGQFAQPPGPAPAQPQAPFVPSVPAAPSPTEAPSPASYKEKTELTSVRVAVENLNRLTGFAGECLVEVKTLEPLTETVQRIKQHHLVLSRAIEQAIEASRKESPFEAHARLEEALGQSGWIHQALPSFQSDLERFSRKLEHLANRLYDEAVASRMRPFSDGLHGFARMVRDVAKSLGKSVRFEIEGESTPVDRDILEKLEAPLTHLLRNAVDHGIEAPKARLRAGKQAEGKLTLAARHVAGALEIVVQDDGAGIDAEQVRQRIVSEGCAPADMAVKMSENEVLEFLFLPGFSTAQSVTEISGRGVGLDVVQSMARQVGGNVRVESKPGHGTRFALQLPLTLSVLRTLRFEVKAQSYALPLTRIEQVLNVPPDEVQMMEDRQYVRSGLRNIGLVGATQVLGFEAADRPPGNVHVVVLGDRSSRYGLVVDRLVGEQDLVVIPLPKRLGKVPNVIAGAILEDGSPVAILDSEDLVRSIDNLLTRGSLAKLGWRERTEKAVRKRVLVVDDSLTVREVERRLLENRGYEVVVAVDGIDGWNALQSSRFDLVVTDVDMPRLDGIELVKRIKGAAPTASIPVMIVSYKDQEEYRTMGLEAGASYYLTKSSFHDETLVSAVRDLIGEAEN